MDKLFLSLAVIAACGTAQAQTYDVDIKIPELAPFVGSFTYSSGTFSNVDVSDPFNGGAFTVVNVSGNTIDLINLEGAANEKAAGSNIFELSFQMSKSLGTGHPQINANTITFDVDFNSTGIWACGPNGYEPDGKGSRPVHCNSSIHAVPVHGVPEFDASLAAGALTLLFGAVAILKTRRNPV